MTKRERVRPAHEGTERIKDYMGNSMRPIVTELSIDGNGHQDGLFSTIRCRISHMGTCSSESHIHTGQCLDFEGDVFDHMSHPGAFLHPLKESATGANAAAMLDHAREHFFEPLPESVDGIGGALLHLLQVEFHLDQFGAAYTPVIGSFQNFDFDNLHKSVNGLTFWVCGYDSSESVSSFMG